MAVAIRPAVLSDLAELGELKLRASLAWGDHLEEIGALPEARVVPEQLLPSAFLAEDADRILGFGVVLPWPARRAELEDLFVDPEHWGRGIGRRLIAEAVRRARGMGADTLGVVAGDRALGFYRACGFELIGPQATLFEMAYGMELRLSRSG